MTAAPGSDNTLATSQRQYQSSGLILCDIETFVTGKTLVKSYNCFFNSPIEGLLGSFVEYMPLISTKKIRLCCAQDIIINTSKISNTLKT